MEIADQTRTDGRLDGRRHAAQTVPFCEWSGENQAQTRRARIEQQAGGDGAAAPDLELCAQQREVRVGTEWHRRARARVAVRQGVEQPHAPLPVVDLHGVVLQHVVPHQAHLEPPARLAQAGEGVQRHPVVHQRELPEANRGHDGGRRGRRGWFARFRAGNDPGIPGPVQVEPGAGEAGVEHQPGGIAVDHRGHVDRAPVGVERNHRHRGDRGGCRTVPAGQRQIGRERRRPGGGCGPQRQLRLRASATTNAAAPSIPSFPVLTTMS